MCFRKNKKLAELQSLTKELETINKEKDKLFKERKTYLDQYYLYCDVSCYPGKDRTEETVHDLAYQLSRLIFFGSDNYPWSKEEHPAYAFVMSIQNLLPHQDFKFLKDLGTFLIEACNLHEKYTQKLQEIDDLEKKIEKIKKELKIY